MSTAAEHRPAQGAAVGHTPAPWIVLPKVWNGATGHFEGPGVFLVQDVATETVICDRRTPWPEKAAEMEANARLIAASPDLLAVCQRLLDHARTAHFVYPLGSLQQLERAVSKATEAQQ